MATKSLLLVRVAVCLLLLVLPAAHGQQRELARVFLGGIARCASNPSKIIINAPLEVSINGTTLVTGETTDTGQYLLVGYVSSTDLLKALLSDEATITAPPQACGGGGTGATGDYVILPPSIMAGISLKTLLDGLDGYDLKAYDLMNKINDLLGIPVTV